MVDVPVRANPCQHTFSDFPFVDGDEEDEREYQERKRRREMKAKEHSRKRSRLSSEEVPEFVKHKRQSVNGHRGKVGVLSCPFLPSLTFLF